MDAEIDQFEMFGSCTYVNIVVGYRAVLSGKIVPQHSADAQVQLGLPSSS